MSIFMWAFSWRTRSFFLPRLTNDEVVGQNQFGALVNVNIERLVPPRIVSEVGIEKVHGQSR